MSQEKSSSSSILALPCVNGCYLPKQESAFIHKVLEELDAYLQRDEPRSVLLFPPLSSHLRFLIHKTAERHPELSTFSVGDGNKRRVAVCCAQLRLPLEERSSDMTSVPNKQPCSQKKNGSEAKPDACQVTPGSTRVRVRRKPKVELYVPRALRQRAAEEQRGEQSDHDLDPSACSPDSKDSPAGLQDPPPAPCDPQAPQLDVFLQPLGAEPSPWPSDLDTTLSYFRGVTLDERDEQDANGVGTVNTEMGSSCPAPEKKEIDKDLHTEIASHLRDEQVEVCSVQNDYPSFEVVWIDEEKFSHVIEIYNFPAVLKTDDLLDAFADVSAGMMKVKWVDDTHALGVFSSTEAALQALSITHPLLKTRTLERGSEKAKSKAVKHAEFIQPVRERPQTDAVVARRMVSRALGLKGGNRDKRC